VFFIQEIIVSYEGEVCGEEGSFPIPDCARGRRNSSALNVLGDQRNFFAAHVLYSQCHANCDQSSVMARNDSANEIAVLIMFDQDLLCLFKFRDSRSTLAASLPSRLDSSCVRFLPECLGI
jgi:hypothetical protein